VTAGTTAAVTITVYQYPKCSTCRKALAWLDGRGVKYESVHIVDSPPSKATLEKARKAAGVPVAKMFNTSGQSYREGGFKAKLAKMTDDQALDALAKDGKLIKRPLVVGDGFALVGFHEAEWARAIRK
jgi:arsenate reductase